MKKFFLLITISFIVFSLKAEVFWLTPLRKGAFSTGTIPLTERLPGVENTSAMLREPVQINGKNFTLELFRSSAAFEDIIRFLEKQGIKFARSNDSLRCAVQLADGTIERLLVVRSPERGPVTVFRIAGTPGVPQNVEWDKNLPPLPSGARALQVIRLPRSNSVYGIYDRGLPDAAAAFRDIDASLRVQGWLPAGNEGSPLIRGNGDIYYHRHTKNILWVSCDNSGRGAFYCRIRKRP